ncbi:MAG TPA: fumarylacetoacetase [Terriglobales bacterium]
MSAINTHLNETHDPKARSWIESANAPETDFPLQNLPFGVFTHRNASGSIGVAIGDQVLDLCTCACNGLLIGVDEITVEACQEDQLNLLMSVGSARWSALRKAIFLMLRDDSAQREEASKRLLPASDVQMLLPAAIGDYTDFYASIFHARNVGALFRPDNPLLPNYRWVPIGYHGRASSIVPSGTPIKRPKGQTRAPESDAPQVGPSKRLDYELEVGVLVGPGNEQGEPVAINDASEHVFGYCLVNDWSARDIQAWEYQPLGPFLAKSFATTLSPWVVTAEALAPFRCAPLSRSADDPQPLPYLLSEDDQQRGGVNISLEVLISSRKMREANCAPVRLSRGNFRDMYWTFAQMLTHHTSNGCNLRPGDLLASGTVSGPEPENRGCLLELTRGGAESITLPTGEQRKFLEDGDEIIIRGYCEREGARRIGFGECKGTIVGSHAE